MTRIARNTVSLTALLLIGCLSGVSAQHQAADQQYMGAMDRMQKDMQSGMDQDATKAWVKMMIPHHRGAIEMSEIVLKETKDPEIRKMAQKSKTEQQKEVRKLQAWLKKHGG